MILRLWLEVRAFLPDHKAMLISLLLSRLFLGWMIHPATATYRQGRNGDRYKGRPGPQSGRDEKSQSHAGHNGDAVHRLVLGIRTNEGPARKKSRRRRRSSSSSSSTSSGRKVKRNIESKEKGGSREEKRIPAEARCRGCKAPRRIPRF